MLFSSTTFLFLFLPVTLLLYYGMPKKLRNGVLLLVSLIFYGWGEPRLVKLMLISILVGYLTGIMIHYARKKGSNGMAKAAVWIAVVYNVGVLAVYKYTDFLIANVNSLFHTDFALWKLALPLGISFYSFQMMSYTIDVYKNDARVQWNPINLAAYLTLFPQLIAGPIVRYQTVADQIEDRTETFDMFAEGVCRFLVGLGKKILLANTIGELFSTLSTLQASQNSVALAWLSSFAFTFQIYFDFSGYSDMAIGLGKMFGFTFLENFNYPYISRSITEFWRRWHISLSSWFRDYVYFPLGGSRHGKGRTIRNIFIVWFLTGFWHGAAWNFIIWGMYFFCLLMVEKLGFLKILERLPGWVQHLYTLFFVNISWVIFSYDTLDTLGHAFGNLFGLTGIPLWNAMSGYYYTAYAWILVVLVLASTPYPKLWYEKFVTGLEKKKAGVYAGTALQTVLVLAVLLMATACLASDSFNPFLYFRF